MEKHFEAMKFEAGTLQKLLSFVWSCQEGQERWWERCQQPWGLLPWGEAERDEDGES